MSTLARKLIAKEFYIHRWIIGGTMVAGLAGLVIAMEGAMRFNIGMLTWLTTIVAFGVVIAMMGIASERKERALQFVLSLPLSPGDYVRIKLVGLFLCYLLPWAILTAGAVTLVAVRSNLPDGLLPFVLLLSVFLLANYSIVLSSALHTASEGLMTIVIIVTNMNVTLFIFMLGSLPALSGQMLAPAPDWNPTFWIVLGAELATLVVTLSLPCFVAARRRDFL